MSACFLSFTRSNIVLRPRVRRSFSESVVIFLFPRCHFCFRFSSSLSSLSLFSFFLFFFARPPDISRKAERSLREKAKVAKLKLILQGTLKNVSLFVFKVLLYSCLLYSLLAQFGVETAISGLMYLQNGNHNSD